MKLSICIPCRNNHTEVWFTVQALRMYQDLSDVEIVVLDNSSNKDIENYVANWGDGLVRYVPYTEAIGSAAAKNAAIEAANSPWVLVIDSHVLLEKNAISKLKEWITANPIFNGLAHGPLLYDNLKSMSSGMRDSWRGNSWGIWNNEVVEKDSHPIEIDMHGMGLFLTNKSTWLGFNKEFKGFGGEEGYIHTKYKQAGRKILCLPFLQWNHYFRVGAAPYPVNLEDIIRNYFIGHIELGLPLLPLVNFYGKPS